MKNELILLTPAAIKQIIYDMGWETIDVRSFLRLARKEGLVANYQLIGAAQGLLDAAKDALEIAESPNSELANRLRAAIAKAEGK